MQKNNSKFMMLGCQNGNGIAFSLTTLLRNKCARCRKQMPSVQDEQVRFLHPAFIPS